MSLGNGNPKSGNKGSNHNFEHRQLLALGELISAVVTGTTGLATEATLLSILNNMIASQDVEILLVRDTGNGDLVVQQIREYDQGTGAWVTRYEDVDGNPYVPVGPLAYLDPSAVLNLILTELLDQGVTLDGVKLDTANLDVLLSTRASEATLVSADSSLATIKTGVGTDGVAHGPAQKGFRALGTDGTNDQQIATDADGKPQVDVISSALPTGAATEATLATLGTAANQVLIINAIASLNASRTPTSIDTDVAGATGNVPVGATEISFFNAGSADATVNGTTIPAGVTRTFGFKNPINAAIAFDALTSRLLIDYMA